jgi:hypothetical protein
VPLPTAVVTGTGGLLGGDTGIGSTVVLFRALPKSNTDFEIDLRVFVPFEAAVVRALVAAAKLGLHVLLTSELTSGI